jgi:hypothetical protein
MNESSNSTHSQATSPVQLQFQLLWLPYPVDSRVFLVFSSRLFANWNRNDCLEEESIQLL